MADTVKYAKELYEAYSYMGSYYLFTKPDYNTSENYYRKIINLDPKNTNWQIKGYSSLGVIYTKRKEYVTARNYYIKVTKLDPNNKAAKSAIENLTKTIDILEVKRQLGE